jgi:hypothetical protein
MARRIDYDSPAVMAEARRKLAQLYAKADTAGRTKLGEDLGYSGKPANIRRSVRRLAAEVSKSESVVVTEYFEPFITNDDPESRIAWKGKKLPAWGLEGRFFINSSVMYLSEYPSGVIAWTQGLNGRKALSSVPALFQRYSDEALLRLQGFYDEDKEVARESGKMLGIAFSNDAAEALIVHFGLQNRVALPERLTDYGIALVPTHEIYKDEIVEGKKKSVKQGYDKFRGGTARPFPKGERRKMIQFINRSHSQRKRRWAE